MRPEIRSDLKAQIESARAFCESEIVRLTEEAELNDRSKTSLSAAAQLHELYDNFTTVGFSEEQAWELIKIVAAK